jgi:dTDP-glucose pyrophosphorylase
MDIKLEAYCISSEGTLFDALRVIDRDAEGFAVALDECGKVYGTLTDGDIRRALLSGETLQSSLKSHACTDFSFVGPEESRAHVLDLMQARRLRQIPIVDRSRQLLGIHFLSHILGHFDRPNWAVIMAGGMGTRLYPITKEIPKPMVKVAGRPILERLVLHLVSHGIRRIFLSVNHLSHVIEDYFQDGKRFGCMIEYLHEDEPLGTAGSLALLPEPLEFPVLVLNGDLVMNADIGAMIDFHERGDYFATMGLKPYLHEIPYGCVEVEGDRICSIEEKPAIQRMVNAGIYVLSSQAVEQVPKEFYPITQLFEEGVQNDNSLGAFTIEEEWIDVGQHAQLRKACHG